MKYYAAVGLFAGLILTAVFPVSASKMEQYIAAQGLVIEQDARNEWERIHKKMNGDLRDYIVRYDQRVRAYNMLMKDRQIKEPVHVARARMILKILESY